MKKSAIGIIIIVIGLILLALIFLSIFNKNNIINDKINEGSELEAVDSSSLGNFCSGEQSCKEFCLNNRGRCESYCKRNENRLCSVIFPPTNVISEDKQVVQPSSTDNKDKPPVLKNFGFDIVPWDKRTNLAGDLIFTKDIIFEDNYIISKWVFVEFGGRGQRKSDAVGSNTEYWFFVPIETDVIAPINGIVNVGFFEHTKDWGINFRTKENSNWIVSFEHVVDVKVKDGDIVKSGDVVAKAAPRINNKAAMTELAVWQGGKQVIKYCPFNFLDDSLKPIYKKKLNQLAKDWEEFIGKNIYEEEKWVSPGCLVESIVEK